MIGGGVAFSSDGHFALSRSHNKKGNIGFLWDLKNGKLVKRIEGHTNFITSLIFCRNDNFALTGSWDRTIKLWDLHNGKCLKTLEGHGDQVESLAVSSSGHVAISTSRDGKLKLWNVAKGKSMRTLECTATSVAISYDSRFGLVGGKSIKLWNMNAGEEHQPILCRPMSSWETTHKIRLIQSIKSEVKAAMELKKASVAYQAIVKAMLVPSYSRDNDLLKLRREVGASGNFSTFKEGWHVRTLKGHSDDVSSVVFSYDGNHILSGSKDKTKLSDYGM
jgi:WD40 repeat protein